MRSGEHLRYFGKVLEEFVDVQQRDRCDFVEYFVRVFVSHSTESLFGFSVQDCVE